MKRRVTIVVEFDPTEYHQDVDSPAGAVILAHEMLNREADLPTPLSITCEDFTITPRIPDEIIRARR